MSSGKVSLRCSVHMLTGAEEKHSKRSEEQTESEMGPACLRNSEETRRTIHSEPGKEPPEAGELRGFGM